MVGSLRWGSYTRPKRLFGLLWKYFSMIPKHQNEKPRPDYHPTNQLGSLDILTTYYVGPSFLCNENSQMKAPMTSWFRVAARNESTTVQQDDLVPNKLTNTCCLGRFIQLRWNKQMLKGWPWRHRILFLQNGIIRWQDNPTTIQLTISCRLIRSLSPFIDSGIYIRGREKGLPLESAKLWWLVLEYWSDPIAKKSNRVSHLNIAVRRPKITRFQYLVVYRWILPVASRPLHWI